MAKYDLKLKTTDAGTQKARTLTLSNVNPEASSNTLKLFTQQLNLLTTNTYVETDYVVTTNLDTETPPIDTRQTPTLAISNPPTLAQVQTNQTAAIQNILVTYDGDGAVYLKRVSGCSLMDFTVFYNGASNVTYVSFTGGQSQTTGGTYILGATGGTNYKPIEVEYTLE